MNLLEEKIKNIDIKLGPYLLDENLMENNNVSTRLKNFVKDAYQKGWTISSYWGNQPSTW